MHPANSINHKVKVALRRVLPFPESARSKNIVPLLEVGKSATTSSYLCTKYPEGVVRYHNGRERDTDIFIVRTYKSKSNDGSFWNDAIIRNIPGRSLGSVRTGASVPSPLSWHIPFPIETDHFRDTKEPWISIAYRHGCTLSRLMSEVPHSRFAPAIPMPLWLYIFLACLDAMLFYREIYQNDSLLYEFSTENVLLVPCVSAPPLISLLGLETVKLRNNTDIEARKANMRTFCKFLRTIRGINTEVRDVPAEIHHHLDSAFLVNPVTYTFHELIQLTDLYELRWLLPFNIPDEEYKEDDGQSEIKWLRETEMYKVAVKASSHMHPVQSRILRTFLEKEVRAEERMFKKEVNRKDLF